MLVSGIDLLGHPVATLGESTMTTESPLSHIGPKGEARMVDVSGKPITEREAAASARVRLSTQTLDALMSGSLPKGDALATARIAGIMAAKRTAEWIPLCHPLALDWVRIDFERTAPDQLLITCTAKTSARTGVEMEALTGASAAALCIYDMAKAADKSIEIGPIRLERKSGGKSHH
jgi:cyclic pyranopterin monophosphate synthase